ncbi:hypothetical protein AAVH_21038, partial [Aphelenchoides avenae]
MSLELNSSVPDMDASMYIVYSLELTLLMLHVSVAVFIASRLLSKQKKAYNSAFYVIFVILAFVDCCSYFS